MKKQLLLIVGLIITTTLFAAPVSKENAQKSALSFLKENAGNMKFAASTLNSTQLKAVEVENAADAYYIFNIGDNQGFVIVSADDRTESILGYSYHGSFDPQNVPSNMQAWLDGYARTIKKIQSLNLIVPKASSQKKPFRHPIPTMLTAQWSQDSPYNDMCPNYNDGHGHRPTGCVATAMAQVMHYYKWPQEKTTSFPAYSFMDDPALGGNGSNRRVEALSGTVFDWENMLDSYSYSSPQKSKDAVAELMLYCGSALHMTYGVEASGAFTFDIPKALRAFGYDKGVKYIERLGYNSFEWEEIIYNELNNKRPVLYSGVAPGAGGHQFVCDGYENGFYHFNWGWEGVSDGFYKLDMLAPLDQGIGGAGDGMNFSDGHQIVIGVQLPVEGSEQPYAGPSIGKMLLSKNTDGEFTKNNLGKVTMYVNSTFAFHGETNEILSVGFGVFDEEGNLLKVVKEKNIQFITGMNGPWNDVNGMLSLPEDVLANNGTLYLKGIRKTETGKWVAIDHSDKIFFKMVVDGDNVHVTQYPLVDVEIGKVSFEGAMCTNSLINLKAEITNNSESFDAVVNLTVNGKVQPNVSQSVSLRRGETKEVLLQFYPALDTKVIYGIAVNGILFKNDIKLDLKEGTSASAKLNIQPKVNITTVGDYLDIPVTITNQSSSSAYRNGVKAILLQKDELNRYVEVVSDTKFVEIDQSGSVETTFHFDGLKFNNIYSLMFAYYSTGKEKIYGGTDNRGNPNVVFTKYKVVDALAYYDAEGNMNYKVVNENETFDIPAEACFVQIPKTVSNRTINKSANPNCIYKMRPGVSLSTLVGCNIVRGNSAQELNLTDAYSYYSSEKYNVSKINLTYKVDNNFSTVWLPFTPTNVTCDSVELKRGYSVADMETADYVLMPCVAEDENTIYFDFDTDYEDVPYVLCVNKKYHGKNIVFSATNLKDVDLSSPAIYGSYFTLCPSNKVSEYNDNIFTYGVTDFLSGNKKVAPFRMYIKPLFPVEKINVVYPEGFITSGIENVNGADEMEGKMVNIYSVDGLIVRIAAYGDNMLEGLPSGIYIVNGKKIVK